MKTALVFGSSGLVGQQLVQQLIHNSAYEKIKLFVRKTPKIQNPKIENIRIKPEMKQGGRTASDGFRDKLIAEGHDGVILKNDSTSS